MNTPFYVQDLYVTRKVIALVQLLVCGVRVEMKDESCRIISDEEWLRIVSFFPPRVERLTRAFFSSHRGKNTASAPIVVWGC